jgi:CheY-like chemotaxis protein
MVLKGTEMPPSPANLPCPNCNATIEIYSAKWCYCLSKNLSVICPSCRSCFCKLLDYPRAADWKLALQKLREWQTEEKFRRALETFPASAFNSSTVLIVDDDEEIRLIAGYTLREMGYRTLTAADASEALAIVVQQRPDFVLTDALMPKLDGRQLCHRIKRLDPTIKVIVMSAVYTKSRYRSEAIKQFQADDYLPKPIDFRHLHDVLQKLSKRAA